MAHSLAGLPNVRLDLGLSQTGPSWSWMWVEAATLPRPPDVASFELGPGTARAAAVFINVSAIWSGFYQIIGLQSWAAVSSPCLAR